MKKKLIYDENLVRELFSRIYPNGDAVFVPLTKDIYKHLPATYKNWYCIAFTKTNKNETIKMIVYMNIEYGSFTKGPGYCASEESTTWESLAKNIKDSFNLRNDKSVLGTLATI